MKSVNGIQSRQCGEMIMTLQVFIPTDPWIVWFVFFHSARRIPWGKSFVEAACLSLGCSAVSGSQNHSVLLQLLWVVICSHLVVVIQYYRLTASQLVDPNNPNSWSRTPPFPQNCFRDSIIWIMRNWYNNFNLCNGKTSGAISKKVNWIHQAWD